MLPRRTKIIATIGPATENGKTIEELIRAGVNLLRFNFKYNTVDWHEKTIEKSEKISKVLGKHISIIADIPKIEMVKKVKVADFVALSYLKDENDVEKLRKIWKKKIIAKIENREALKNIEKIIMAADGIMVARGDLGEAVPIEELAWWQKKIIDRCRVFNKPVIVATEMLLSMVKRKTPTRAEASDVANAVYDGTDALMLSEETSIGKNPVAAVKVMAKIAGFAEVSDNLRQVQRKPFSQTELLVETTIKMARGMEAIIVFTRSGETARIVSSYRPLVPIIAVTNDRSVWESLNLSYGVIPFFKELGEGKFDVENPVFAELVKNKYLKSGSKIMVIHGNNWIITGMSSNVSIMTV